MEVVAVISSATQFIVYLPAGQFSGTWKYAEKITLSLSPAEGLEPFISNIIVSPLIEVFIAPLYASHLSDIPIG